MCEIVFLHQTDILIILGLKKERQKDIFILHSDWQIYHEIDLQLYKTGKSWLVQGSGSNDRKTYFF